MSVYSLSRKQELRALVKEQVAEITAKVWENELPKVENIIQQRLNRTLVESAVLSSKIKKEINLKNLPGTSVPYKEYVATVQKLTSDKKMRGKLYQYRNLAMRSALLRTLLDKEASRKKLLFKVITILEAVVETLISNAVNEAPIGQIVHKSYRAFKVNYILTKEGDKIEEVTPWMVDELILQLISELAELDMLNMKVSSGTHMISIPDGLAARVSKDEWHTLARDSAISRRKTILIEKSEVQSKNMISQSSWFYQTPRLSESIVKFLEIMNSVKYGFKPTAAAQIREKLLNHLKVNKLPSHGEVALSRFQDQIQASKKNGGHFVAGIFDSANRYYLLSEVGHLQSSEALRSLVEVEGITDPVKWDMRNNVTQMYAVSLKNKLLASSCGLVAEKDATTDIRERIANGLNRMLKVEGFSKDNVKPLFMVWAYNAGKGRILEGVVKREKDFLTGHTVVTRIIPGLRALAGSKIIDDDKVWGAWMAMMQKHVSAIIALKMLFKQLIKYNPLTEASWVMPDGTISQYTSAETVSQELNWVSSNGTMRVHTHYRKEIVEDAKASGLLPRVIHSIDAYLMRQLVIRMNKLGIIVVPNHDSFLFDRKHEATVTKAVKELLIEVMEKEILSDIVKQLNKSEKALKVRTADGRAVTVDMFGERLTKEDILAGMPMAKEEL